MEKKNIESNSMVHYSNEYKIQIKQLSQQGINANCADCGAYGTQWASTNLGIYLCLDCAGAHRSLGTHISKVRSITLDTWNENLVDTMRKKGNEVNNALFPKPKQSDDTFTSSESRTAFIRSRYVTPQDDSTPLGAHELFQVMTTKISHSLDKYKGFVHFRKLNNPSTPQKLSFTFTKQSPEKESFRKNHLLFCHNSCFSLPSSIHTGSELNTFFRTYLDNTAYEQHDKMLLNQVEPLGPCTPILFFDPDQIVFIDSSGLLKAYSLYDCKISMHILIQASLIEKIQDDCIAIAHDHTLAVHNFVDHNRFLVQLDIPSEMNPIHVMCELKNEKSILFGVGKELYVFDWEAKLADTQYRKSKASSWGMSQFSISNLWSNLRKNVNSTIENFSKIPFCKPILSGMKVVQIESLNDDRFIIATSSGDINLYTNDGMFLYFVGNHSQLIKFGLLGRYTLFSYSNQELYLWDYVYSGNIHVMDNLTEDGLYSIVDVIALQDEVLVVVRSDGAMIHIQCMNQNFEIGCPQHVESDDDSDSSIVNK